MLAPDVNVLNSYGLTILPDRRIKSEDNRNERVASGRDRDVYLRQ